jgi:hypothetical protein
MGAQPRAAAGPVGFSPQPTIAKVSTEAQSWRQER